MREPQRSLNVEGILARDLERHWRFPEGILSQGRVMHLGSGARRAAWTPGGGVVSCSAAVLAARITGVIARHVGDDYAALLAELQEELGEDHDAASSCLDLGLYCCELALLPKADLHDRVEMLRPEDLDPDGFPSDTEHVFAIRAGSSDVARAFNSPRFEADGYRFHALGAGVRPDHRNQGLGKAVVSALVEHLASEGGVALWDCDVLNVPSLRLARSVGFHEWLWDLRWGVNEGEMRVRRRLAQSTRGDQRGT